MADVVVVVLIVILIFFAAGTLVGAVAVAALAFRRRDRPRSGPGSYDDGGQEPWYGAARSASGRERAGGAAGPKLGSVQHDTLGNARGDRPSFPWPATSATGIGSMPGTDPAEAMRIIAGELPDFPYLPELPARGPGADLTGRTAALLVDMPVETTPGGWRIAERPGRYMRAARSMLSSDLDALEEVMSGYAGPLKISLCGPWTLSATIELPRRLDAILADSGAVADLTASLAEAAAAHVAEVAKRMPAAQLVVQFDEPALAAVAGGEVPTASGLSRLPAVDAAAVADRLGTVLAAAGRCTIVHCCATPVPFGIIMAARPAGVAFDLSLLRREQMDDVAEAAEAGIGILAGVVPAGSSASAENQGAGAERAAPGGTSSLRRPSPRGLEGKGREGGGRERSRGRPDEPADTAERVLRFWRRLGMAPARCAEQVVISPSCGLAGASPAMAISTLAHCREAARIVPELAEEMEDR
jgi:methionine synthase II (cobalamin-independent)